MSAALGLATVAALPASEEPTFGFSHVPLKANSDNYLPVPYAKTPLWQGALSEDASVTGTTATFTLPGCPVPAEACYLRFRTGALAGRYYHVSSSDGLGVVVNTNGDNQAALAVAGDEVSLMPFWTLGELLPPGGFGVPTTDTGLPYLIDLLGIQVWGHQAGGLNTTTQWVDGVWQYGTWCPNTNLVSVLFPDHSSPGTDLPLQSQAYPACEAFALNDDGTPAEYLDSVGMSVTSNFIPHWFDDAGNNLDSRIIPPDGFVVLRSGNWAGADGHITLGGYNEPGPWVTPLSTRTSGPQDTYLAFPLVRPVLFSQLQIEGGLLPSPDMWDSAGDLMFTYWPGTSGFMRSAEGMFFPTLYDGWVDYFGSESMETYLIPAHTVFFIRRNQTTDGASSFLKYQPAN